MDFIWSHAQKDVLDLMLLKSAVKGRMTHYANQLWTERVARCGQLPEVENDGDVHSIHRFKTQIAAIH